MMYKKAKERVRGWLDTPTLRNLTFRDSRQWMKYKSEEEEELAAENTQWFDISERSANSEITFEGKPFKK